MARVLKRLNCSTLAALPLPLASKATHSHSSDRCCNAQFSFYLFFLALYHASLTYLATCSSSFLCSQGFFFTFSFLFLLHFSWWFSFGRPPGTSICLTTVSVVAYLYNSNLWILHLVCLRCCYHLRRTRHSSPLQSSCIIAIHCNFQARFRAATVEKRWWLMKILVATDGSAALLQSSSAFFSYRHSLYTFDFRFCYKYLRFQFPVVVLIVQQRLSAATLCKHSRRKRVPGFLYSASRSFSLSLSLVIFSLLLFHAFFENCAPSFIQLSAHSDLLLFAVHVFPPPPPSLTPLSDCRFFGCFCNSLTAALLLMGFEWIFLHCFSRHQHSFRRRCYSCCFLAAFWLLVSAVPHYCHRYRWVAVCFANCLSELLVRSSLIGSSLFVVKFLNGIWFTLTYSTSEDKESFANILGLAITRKFSTIFGICFIFMLEMAT